MANVGSLNWLVKMQNAAKAKSSAKGVAEGFDDVADKARQAEDVVEEAGDAADKTSGEFDNLSREAGQLSGMLRLVKSGLMGIGGVSLGGMLGGGGLGSITSMITGASLGSLITKVSFASLLKALPALGALVIAADTIGAMIDGKAPITAFVESAEDFGEFVLNPIGLKGDLIETVFGIGTFILGTMSIASFITGVSITAMIKGAAATIASYLGVSSISALVSGAGASIATFVGSVGIGTLVVGVGSVAALIYGVASLGDLIDGDISSWNLPGKFGHALGEGFARAWPDMAEKIHTAFTNNPIYDAGEWTGNVLRGEGEGAVEGENRELSADMETGFIDPRETPGLSQAYDAGQAVGDWKWTGLASGGIVTGPTPAMIGEGGEDEAVLPLSKLDSMLGGDSGPKKQVKQLIIKEQTIEIGDQSIDISELGRTEMEELASLISEKQHGTFQSATF
jgi:hypothetical protein